MIGDWDSHPRSAQLMAILRKGSIGLLSACIAWLCILCMRNELLGNGKLQKAAVNKLGPTVMGIPPPLEKNQQNNKKKEHPRGWAQ